MKPFAIGEIAIAQHFENFPEYNGCECTVIGGLEPRSMVNDDMTVKKGIWMSRVQFADGMCLGPVPSQLRRPMEPTVDQGILDEITA